MKKTDFRTKITMLSLTLVLAIGILPTVQTYKTQAAIPVPVADSNATTFSTGSYHSLIIKNDGSLWTYGTNTYGQLGDGTTTSNPSPTAPIMNDVIAVSARAEQSFAIKNDGTLWAWGSNSAGQLGDGTTEKRLSPVKIMDGVAAVKAGITCTLAIKTDDTLWAWGSNSRGQLGDGTANNRLKPVKIMDNVITADTSGYHSVSAGGAVHVLAMKNDGSLWGWGRNDDGLLGNGKKIAAMCQLKS
jgi:alpha-tubulin suppressor-like RCC1 family protein